MYDPKYEKRIEAFEEYLLQTPPNKNPLAKYEGEWITFEKNEFGEFVVKKEK